MRRRGKGRRKERERGCLPRPVLLPYYTQGNNNYTCRDNKAIIIIVAILHSSRSLIVICFRIMPAQCRRQCQSLNSMLFHNPLISQNLVPINSSTKNDQPSDNQKSLVKFPTQEMRYLTQMIWIYSNEPKWTRALSKWRCVQNDEAPGRWWTHGSQAQSQDRQTSPSGPTMHCALCTVQCAVCAVHYAKHPDRRTSLNGPKVLCTMHYTLCTMHYTQSPDRQTSPPCSVQGTFLKQAFKHQRPAFS